MYTLVDLCVDTLITCRIPSIVILDKIPYDLYEKYKKKKFELEIASIRPIVKCIIGRDIYCKCFQPIIMSREFNSISNCIIQCENWQWIKVENYVKRYYPFINFPHPLDDRFIYSNVFAKYIDLIDDL